MQSDITKLLNRLDSFLDAVNAARGTASDLVNAAPLELHFYNIATRTKQELDNFKACLEDANGTYLKKERDGS